MKRIATLPTSLKITEGILPFNQVIPRSGKEEVTTSFPCEEFTGEKYPTHKFTPQRYSGGSSDISLSFVPNVQGVYEGTLVCKGISKGSYSQANDKLYTYDKDTGAHFSMDMEDVFNLIMGMTQSRHTVKAEGGGYEISGRFIMRGHFLSPYTEEVEASFIKKQADKKNALKPKDIVPSKDKIYVTKNGDRYLYLGSTVLTEKYNDEIYGNGTRGMWREPIVTGHKEKIDTRIGNLFLRLGREKDGMIDSYSDFRSGKPTTILSVEDAETGTFDKCVKYLLREKNYTSMYVPCKGKNLVETYEFIDIGETYTTKIF